MDDIQVRLYQWTQCDNQLKEINKKASVLRKQKDELQSQILPILQQEQLTENTFSIPALKTTVLCKTHSTNESITYKLLQELFTSYFNSTDKANELIQFIKQNRKKQTHMLLKTTELIEMED